MASVSLPHPFAGALKYRLVSHDKRIIIKLYVRKNYALIFLIRLYSFHHIIFVLHVSSQKT